MTTVLDHRNEHPDTDAPMGVPPPHSRRRRSTRLLGLALIVGAIGLIAVGAIAAIFKIDGTYVDLGARGTYRTDRYGLASASTAWDRTLLGWAGTVRLKVESTDGAPIFVGVAPPAAIRSYLAEVGYTTLEERRQRGIVRTDHDGGAPIGPPAHAVGWTAHAQGPDTQTVRWKATGRRQIVLAMNADRSRHVSARIISSAVTVDGMPWRLPEGVLAIGMILLTSGVVTVRRA